MQMDSLVFPRCAAVFTPELRLGWTPNANVFHVKTASSGGTGETEVWLSGVRVCLCHLRRYHRPHKLNVVASTVQ